MPTPTVNISKGLLAQVESRKHALVQWAIREGKLTDPAYLEKKAGLDNLIRGFGGDPTETDPD